MKKLAILAVCAFMAVPTVVAAPGEGEKSLREKTKNEFHPEVIEAKPKEHPKLNVPDFREHHKPAAHHAHPHHVPTAMELKKKVEEMHPEVVGGKIHPEPEHKETK